MLKLYDKNILVKSTFNQNYYKCEKKNTFFYLSFLLEKFPIYSNKQITKKKKKNT